ncbi:hypothetical protein TCAL_07916 [Tigriopus californicus]|uniref:C-type lectin domain-containing protein n=1 Tax=Tigriopus californicus TaxID=6832 RepID=A0A553PI80_TIGCA|nr:uncharacterized protein LOC131880665 [Tigriopus californicus]TRY77384.1 hypothetical protein TCAL_07916 [Tigriopus californicus]
MFIKEFIFAIVIGVAVGQFGNTFRRPSIFRNFGGSSQSGSAFSGAQSSGSSPINYQGQTGQYHLSWRAARASPMRHSDAIRYCKSLNMNIVSFDGSNGNAKAAEINSVVVSEAPYYWTGGKVTSGGTAVRWNNGRVDPIPPKCPKGTQCNRGLWSNAGNTPGGQPETDEECVAVLIHTYTADRGQPHYHDVACHHPKPTVCE